MLEITIKGPVLLLMGPIGTFFSRMYYFFQKNSVEVHKIMLPLHEFCYPSKNIHYYSKPSSEFRKYIIEFYKQHNIKHVFMYGDFIDIHKIAVEEGKKLDIETWIFELGYVRPNYVTLEQNRANARSNLNQPLLFYQSLPAEVSIIKPDYKEKYLWRKLAMIPTFIQHSLVNYKLITGEHKLQPKPSYLFYQMRGYFRFFQYKLIEKPLKRRLLKIKNQFTIFLQVSIDSQLTLSSQYKSVGSFINEVITSFAKHAPTDSSLVFKHHPRDRGYNNYKKIIEECAEHFRVSSRVHYYHDISVKLLYPNTIGVVTVNSSAGISALHSGIPVKVMGKTFYNLEGLCSNKSLDEFWENPGKVDNELFKKFYNYMIRQTQVNGSFYGYFPFSEIFKVN